MARQTINIGAAPNDGTGDAIRVGGDKINDNFIELYNDLSVTREFDRAWDSELLFDKNEIHYEQHELTSDTEFTLASIGHLSDQFSSIVQEIVTDGTHAVTFNGFKYVLGDVQSGSIPEAGTHIVFFLYFNGIATVNWSIPTSEVANLTPLSAPANFAAIVGTDPETEVDLSWDTVPNASSYEIDYSSSGGSGPWISLATPAAVDTSYTHTGLIAATTYHYRIRAIGDQVTFSNSQYSLDAVTTEDVGDVTAPTFTFSPADAATDIPVNRQVVITASEALRDADGVTVITDANVADYLTVKEDNISGADIPFTATIDAGKMIITITPDVVYPSSGDVFVQIDGVEDVNGNESAADDATFTTSDYTEMEGDFLSLGTQIDSVVTGNDINFELEAEYKDIVLLSGTRGLFQKNTSTGNQRSLVVYTDNNDVYFQFYTTSGSNFSYRSIRWANALSGFTEGKLTFKYFGAIDTNNGLDRVDFYIDDVLVSSGKSVTAGGVASWPFAIAAGTAPFYFSGPTFREVRNFKVRNNMGATTVVDIPVIRTGTDVSGNSFDGTWV